MGGWVSGKWHTERQAKARVIEKKRKKKEKEDTQKGRKKAIANMKQQIERTEVLQLCSCNSQYFELGSVYLYLIPQVKTLDIVCICND